MALGDVVEILALVFLAGAFWQRTGAVNETLKEVKLSFDASIKALTDRVNDHGERLGRLEGKFD